MIGCRNNDFIVSVGKARLILHSVSQSNSQCFSVKINPEASGSLIVLHTRCDTV